MKSENDIRLMADKLMEYVNDHAPWDESRLFAQTAADALLWVLDLDMGDFANTWEDCDGEDEE